MVVMKLVEEMTLKGYLRRVTLVLKEEYQCLEDVGLKGDSWISFQEQCLVWRGKLFVQ